MGEWSSLIAGSDLSWPPCMAINQRISRCAVEKKQICGCLGLNFALKSTEYQTYSIKSWDEFCFSCLDFFWYLIVFWHGISGWWHGMLACNFTKIVASNLQYPLERIPRANSPLPERGRCDRKHNRPILPPIVVATFLGKGKKSPAISGKSRSLGWWNHTKFGQIYIHLGCTWRYWDPIFSPLW